MINMDNMKRIEVLNMTNIKIIIKMTNIKMTGIIIIKNMINNNNKSKKDM